jgi:hypothetical protein
MKKMIEVFK